MAVRKRQQLGRSDWLEAALTALERGGPEAVRVLPLAKKLGVSRGSFYWHFRDRAELLDCVLDYWDTEITAAVIERSRAASVDAAERLRRLFEEVVNQRRGRYDPIIRAWALHDRRAAAVVRRVDRKRMAYLMSLFRAIGFSESAAEARARVALTYLVGDHVLLVHEPAERRRKLLRQRYELLTRR